MAARMEAGERDRSRVLRRELEEMARDVRRAARVPFPARERLRRFLEALFDHAIEHPETYRLLLGGAPLAVDPALGATATATRIRLVDEVARILAGSVPTPQVAAASAGVVGFALANIGLCLAGRLVPEHAWRVTCEFCTWQLPPTDRLDDG
jgi:hypothetical protein